MSDEGVSNDLCKLRGLQQAAWQRGERLFVQTLLDQCRDQPPSEDVVLELILSEHQLREEVGDHPAVEDYVSRFPHLAERLRRLFAVHAALEQGPSVSSVSDESSVSAADPADAALEVTRLFPKADAKQLDAVSTERHLLFAVLAFESDLLDLPKLTAACLAWAADKSLPLADLLVQRGWINAEDQAFIEKQLERKLAKHQHDPRVTLNAITRGDVCDALKELNDSDINQSLSSWPSVGPVLVEAIGEPSADSSQANSRYTWLSEVGKGGLGKVWLARDNDLVREVALKEIKPGSASKDAIRMLIKEAQITGQLQHPNIVPVYEVHRGGRPFYTMKLVKGETLAKAIQQHHERRMATLGHPQSDSSSSEPQTGKSAHPTNLASGADGDVASLALSMQRLMSVFLNVCDALAYAHSRGVIHRDLKPQNIVLGDYGEAIVLDWGLARKIDQKDDDLASIRITGDAQTEATQAGSVLGSPSYMAPEQAAGQIDLMDQRTDVYGLGAILFETLTGRAPHRKTDTESIVSLLRRISTGDTPHVCELDSSLPEELDSICAKAMGKTRDERYQTAKDLKAALLEFQVHKESIDLAASAAEGLDQAHRTSDYQDFSRALFGFEEAWRQWPHNTRASDGLRETRTAYAETAFHRGDYDLALSLLEASMLGTLARPSAGQECPFYDTHEASSDLAALRTKIQLAATERASRQTRILRLRRFSISASLTAAVIASIAAVWINAERQTANAERQNAVTAKGKADAQRERADKNAATATTNSEIADANAALERTQRKRADEKERESRLILYATHMNLAESAWEDTLVNGVVQLLDQYGPETPKHDLRGFEWFYWYRKCQLDLLTLKGHTHGVASVAFSPDGGRLASASGDQTVKLWDGATGQETTTLKGHSDAVTSVAFSPDGARIASGSRDKLIKLWDVASCQETATLRGHTDIIECVAFSPDGTRLASASYDKTVRLWNVITGVETATLKGHIKGVTCVAFSPDGQRIAAATYFGDTIKVWDAVTGLEIATFQGHSGIHSIIFSPDSKLIALAGVNKPVKILEASTGQVTLALNADTYAVYTAVFSPDGMQLATGGYDQTVKLWDVANGKLMTTMKGHTSSIDSVAFSPDGKRVASGSSDSTVKLWDSVSNQETQTSRGHRSNVKSVAFSLDGSRFASASSDQTVKLWDAMTGQETATLKGHSSIVFCVAFSPDGTQVASASYDQTVKLWDVATAQEVLTLKGHTDQVRSVAFSPNGTLIASGSHDNTVKLWDSATGQERSTLTGHKEAVMSVTFSPDGSRIASASCDKTIKIWDTVSGQETATLKGHTGVVDCVAFSPDGKQIASGSHDQSVKLWDSISGKEAATLKGHSHLVWSVAFSPDGARVASACGDKTVKLWDTVSGQETSTLKGHTNDVECVAFSPDGKWLASASSDGTVKLWDGRPEAAPNIKSVELEARKKLELLRPKAASREELLAAIQNDNNLPLEVKERALILAKIVALNATIKGAPIMPPSEAAKKQDCSVATDWSSLATARKQQLIYVLAQGGLNVIRFGEHSREKWMPDERVRFPVTALATKPATQTVFILSQDRLYLVDPPPLVKTEELYHFSIHAHDVALHPTDDRLAWCRRPANTRPELIISKLDGTEEANLGFGYDPNWTADGSKLIYTGAVAGEWAIGIRDGTQTTFHKVSAHPLGNIYPTPSPNGEQIIFAMEASDGTMQLGQMSFDGTNRRQLTRKGNGNSQAAYSPDGRYIAFIRGITSPACVVIVDTQTGEETVIADDAQSIRPVWHASSPSTKD